MLLFKYGKYKIKVIRKRSIKDFFDFFIFKLFHDKKAETGGRDIKIPDHEIEALARAILPDMIKFFESEKGKSEFENWKKERDSLKAANIA